MSSILDALNKLEQERLAQQNPSSEDEFTGSPEKAAAELFGKPRARARNRRLFARSWIPLVGASFFGVVITSVAVVVVFWLVSTPTQRVAAVPVPETKTPSVHTYSLPIKTGAVAAVPDADNAATGKAQSEKNAPVPPQKQVTKEPPRTPDLPKPAVSDRVTMVREPVAPREVLPEPVPEPVAPPVVTPEPAPEPVAPPAVLPEPAPEPVAPPAVTPEPAPEPVAPPAVLPEPEAEPVAPPPVLPEPAPSSVVAGGGNPEPIQKEESTPVVTAEPGNGSTTPGRESSPKETERLAFAPPVSSPLPEKKLPAMAVPPAARTDVGRVDINSLPRLSTQDRENLGLDNLQLNVLRPADKNQPDALAIINLKKVYVGEMIPGTPARLIGVEAGAIGVEIDKGGAQRQFKIPR